MTEKNNIYQLNNTTLVILSGDFDQCNVKLIYAFCSDACNSNISAHLIFSKFRFKKSAYKRYNGTPLTRFRYKLTLLSDHSTKFKLIIYSKPINQTLFVDLIR